MPVKRLLLALLALPFLATPARALTTWALLDTIQHTAFDYFWLETNPANGLTRDRNQSWSPCSIASQGFGLSAICIGVDHGWVTRPAARTRVLTTLQTYFNGSQAGTLTSMGYQGLFYHFLTMNFGQREWSSELSTIDTALLMAGVIDAREFFNDPNDATEQQIRWYADTLYKRVNWDWTRNGGVGIRMGWKPDNGQGFNGFGEWIGYNEAMILYILALGSPTYPLLNTNNQAWNRWTSNYRWETWYGQTYVRFAPLFGHQYSHCWIDFRYIQDAYMRNKGITYFENSRRATYAQRSYCMANPGGWPGYSGVEWGITAGDGPPPNGYRARGAPPAENDDGTITPTAAVSSIAFTPEIVIPTIHHLYDTYGSIIWGTYGFTDGFNISVPWWDQDVIGIDQGPMILMIENYRTGKPWSRFMSNPWVQSGLARADFQMNPLPVDPEPQRPVDALELEASPNPYAQKTTLRFTLPTAGRARVAVYDVQGRERAVLVDDERPAGPQVVEWNDPALGAGIWFVKLEHGGRSVVRRCVRLR